MPLDESPDTLVTGRSFQSWLQSVENMFGTLSNDQRNRFLKSILSLCTSDQICFLVQSYLPSIFHRDFLGCLPKDCGYNILKYLDGDTILKCCLVSKSWYQVVSGCKGVWVRLLMEAGEKRPTNLSLSAQTYKQMVMRRHHLNDRLKEGGLIEQLMVTGPVGTCKVTGIMYKHPFIMLVSDGKDIHLWNTTEECFDDTSYQIAIQQNSISTFYMDDKFIYAGLYDGKALSWQLYTNHPHCSYSGHVNTVLSISALKSRNLVLTTGADYAIKLLDLDSGQVLSSFLNKVSWIRHTWFLNNSLNDTVLFLSFSNLCVNAWTISKNDENMTEYTVNISNQWKDVLALVVMDDGASFYIQQQKLNLDESITEIYHYTMTLTAKKNIAFICSKKIIFETQLSDFLFKDELFAVGNRFAVILRQNIEDKECSLIIRDVTMVTGIKAVLPMPYFRSLLGEPLVALCNRDWLDGFDDTNQAGVVYASPLQMVPTTRSGPIHFRTAVYRWKHF